MFRNRLRNNVKAIYKVCYKIISRYWTGITFCKNIVEDHGDIIWADNNKNGERGEATFSFILPMNGCIKKQDYL